MAETAKPLWGRPVAERLDAKTQKQVSALKSRGVAPALALVRVGGRPDDLAYERSILKHAEKVGLQVKMITLPTGADTRSVIDAIGAVNRNAAIHGCLIFRPMGAQIDDAAVCGALDPAKDVDGITLGSLAGVFTGKAVGYPPCTAEACLKILDAYDIDPAGKKVCVVGRSLVIGRPVAMMLLARNATVTICHTRTVDAPAIMREAEIIVAAAGQIGSVTAEGVAPNGRAVIVDVGINFNDAGQMVGDATPDAAARAGAVTPVPGGVGTVTTAVLCRHVVQAAQRQQIKD
jgi:methylenetetrahydrofolate dehydrogenase (NADP+)/methenyltetrahydrofolate cyclohydrolase